MARTKTNTQTTQKHAEDKYATNIQKNYYFCVFRSFFYFILFCIHSLLNDFSNKNWVTAFVRSITFIGGLNLLYKQTQYD